MVGIDRNENEVVCTAMSALIQYFTLATVLWMGAEAVLMFQKLIIVFGKITVKYFVIVSLICWCKFLHLGRNAVKLNILSILHYPPLINEFYAQFCHSSAFLTTKCVLTTRVLA